METGTKVRLSRDIERYPHFTAPEGATGQVVAYDDEIIRVKLDDKLPGAEEWDNELHWYPDMFEQKDFRDAFREDVAVVEE